MDDLLEQAVETATHEHTTDAPALRGSSFDYLTQPGTDLAAKAQAFHAWAQTRVSHGVFPYAKRLGGRPGATAELTLLDGQRHAGLNFSSQEYLSLARHPKVTAAAQAAQAARIVADALQRARALTGELQ